VSESVSVHVQRNRENHVSTNIGLV
jgi:hypothetical protein